jgi:hypothetical protein
MAAIIAGKEPRSSDPAVSEWGNPARFIPGHFAMKMPCIMSMKLEFLMIKFSIFIQFQKCFNFVINSLKFY